MKKLFFIAFLLLSIASSPAGMTISPWQQLFQGVDHAVGTNYPDATIPRLQVAHCIRVDLSNPDVQLFTTPPAPNFSLEGTETLTLTVSNFLKSYHLAVAIDANFYDANPGGSDPPAEGLPCEVHGLQICTGAVVSVPDFHNRYASLMFTRNKQAFFDFDNRPPGTNTDDIYTAITGYYPILSNGVNFAAAAIISYPDQNIHAVQPRTVHGVSGDGQYLFMMTIDGRQSGYSEGALDTESARWMLQFGGWNAINMDGGGSTALYMADCAGNPVALNHSSFVVLSGGARERYIGSHFGVFAKPLPSQLGSVTVIPGDTTAIVSWQTGVEATTQVEYGPTLNFGSSTPVDSMPATNHIATLTGLFPGANYYFRAVSVADGNRLTSGCQAFRTTNSFDATELLSLTSSWKYTTNNLDGVNWPSPGYDDSGWSGPSPALLYVEDNGAVAPRNTLLPPGFVSPPLTVLPPTYYFRTHFNFTGSTANVSLVFSNYIDDGAVFYLNGAEVARVRMPSAPTRITYTSLANGSNPSSPPCSGDATVSCPTLFTLSGSVVQNLVPGDNLLAAEVHNFNVNSPDIVFGAALSAARSTSATPRLNIYASGDIATLYWNGSGFTLEQATVLDPSSNSWSMVSGPLSPSPVTVTNSDTKFYRLRQ